MRIRLIPKPRREGEIVPEGLSVTKTDYADHVYIRRSDTIARIRITKDGRMTYEVRTLES